MAVPAPFKKKPGAPSPKLSGYLSEDLHKTILKLLLALGFFNLFSYFFHIDYFPGIDLQGVTGHILPMAFILVLLTTGLSLPLMSPYLFSAPFITVRPGKLRNGKAIAEIMEWMAYGFLSLALLAGYAYLYTYLDWPLQWALCNWAGTALAAFGLRMRAARTRRLERYVERHVQAAQDSARNRLLARKKFDQVFNSKALGGILVGTLSILPLLVLLDIVSRASAIKDDDWLAFIEGGVWYALLLSIVCGVLLYCALSRKHRRKWFLAIPVLLLLPIVLSTVMRAPAMLQMAVAHITKSGNFRANKVVLSPKACDSVAPILGIECADKNPKPIQLCNVHIMSRVGPETYLRVGAADAGSDGKHAVLRVFVPTADIAAMEVNFNVKELRLSEIDAAIGKTSYACPQKADVTYGDSAFKTDGYTLSEKGRTQLNRLVQSIKDSPSAIAAAIITGHADSTGSASYNDWLAGRRATEVRLFLESELRNLPAKVKLSSESKGSSQPLVSDCGKAKDRRACEAPNRRVEVRLIEADKAGSGQAATVSASGSEAGAPGK